MFVGREEELSIIEKKILSPVFEFGLIYGRRRIGKTYLLQEVVKKHSAIYFVASELGIDYNLKQLSRLIAAYFNEPIMFEDFSNLFRYVANKSQNQKTVLIIDEFTYLLSSENGLLSVFQNAIDQYLVNSRCKLILSGSHVGMIEDALTYKKPLYGRSTFKLKIEAFDYYNASKFYPSKSPEEKVRLYSIFGGIPFYLSRIDDSKSLKDIVIELILQRGAMFEDEISFFLSQEVRSLSTYGLILNAIASGATRLNEITSKSGSSNSGNISKYLDTLRMLGVIEKEVCFGEKGNSKKTLYRIKDQLFRFHYTFIEKERSRKVTMNAESFYDQLIHPKLDEYVALEFENVCKSFLLKKFRNQAVEIGRFWYNDSKLRLDIEIDIVMKTEDEISAFECKWTNSPINQSIAEQLKSKSKHINAVTFGAFSRTGYTESAEKLLTYSFTVSDLFD
jgi:uncharacterized protein